jgi:glucose/arabinose dehydrogenase
MARLRIAFVGAIVTLVVLGGCAPLPGYIDRPTPDESASGPAWPPSVITDRVDVAPPAPRSTYVVPSGAEPETIVSGLEAPWQVVFLPDGQALVDERDSGRILQIGTDFTTRVVEIVGGRPPCTKYCEGGTLGMAVVHEGPPSVPYSGWSLFVYYTTLSDNRLVKYRLERSTAGEWSLHDQAVVLSGIARSARSTTHNGGRLEIGPDGKLWVGLGDAGMRGYTSQDPTQMAGSVLRVNVDGTVPADNPDPTSYVYAKGIRDTQGIAFDDFGRAWGTEFGEDSWDELNLLTAGANYGWPAREGYVAFEGGFGDPARFVDPVWVSPVAEASPSGLTFHAGSLIAACLRGGRLIVWPVVGDGKVGPASSYFVGKFGRLRDAQIAPDGSLWVLTSNRDGRGGWSSGGGSPLDDRILRVELVELPLP